MGRYIFRLPDVGEGMAEAEIGDWHVAVGGAVHEDDPLVDMMTDKATIEITSPVSGTVVALHGAKGDKRPIGSDLVILEVDGAGNEDEAKRRAGSLAAASPKQTVQPQLPPPTPSVLTQERSTQQRPDQEHPAQEHLESRASQPDPLSPAARPADEPPQAAPATRRRAHELGIELQYVAGTGTGGRITPQDLDLFIASRQQQPGRMAGVPAQRTTVSEVPVVGLRRTIAERLQDTKRRVPHFAYVEEIDMTALEELRASLNARYTGTQPKLTLLPFLIRAVAVVVPDFPMINARFDDIGGIVQRHAAVHVGIATQTAAGLVVTVVRHAEALSLWQTASELQRLADLARAGKAAKAELTGSTITISSLGPIGGVVTTPIINAPEVAIIGVNKLTERPTVRAGQVVVRTMMNLSSSFDHRVVDGWDAASFIQAVRQRLETPATLFMDLP